ncbi:hypothetical protein E7744_01395 [Citricoccus sp. SGAir0253]|uniref:hypothetical protein n=1 Tax=Citricoccus sp. SGAir0253 TaxID=2567881 RepID=UPI0010CD4D9A|nr:hypothetical protein [Citricoccus sp. SGAir0253]QCU77025.1 hypothetical protein E7744_01395 [Citricoccus sp. SGAir0253]
MRRRRGVIAVLLLALTACGAVEAPDGGATGPAPRSSTTAPGPEGGSSGMPGGEGDGGAPGVGPGSTAGPGLPFEGPVPPGAGPGGRPGATVYRRSTPRRVCASLGAARPLELSTTDPAEAWLLRDWDACLRTDTTPAYTWLRNRTTAVWSLPGSPWAVVQQHSPGRARPGVLRSGVLHRASADWTGSPGAAAFVHPGESVWIAADPDRVRWRADLPLTLTWSAVGVMMDRVEGRGSAVMAEFLRRRESGPGVATTCAAGFYAYVRARDARDREDLAAADPGVVVHEGFEALSRGSPCAEAAAGLDLDVGGRRTTVLDEVIRAVAGSGAALDRIRADVGPYRRARDLAGLRLGTVDGPTPRATSPGD